MAKETPNISRDVDVEADIYFSPEAFKDADNVQPAMNAVKAFAERNVSEKNDGEKVGISDLEIKTIKFAGFEDSAQNTVDAETVSSMTAQQLEDITAVVHVEATAKDNGIAHEGYTSHDYYEPDEPAYVEGNDIDEAGSEIVDYIENAFKEFKIEPLDSDVTDVSAPEWDVVMERDEEYARAEQEDRAYEAYRERQMFGDDY